MKANLLDKHHEQMALRDDDPTQPIIGPIHLAPAHELVIEQIRRSIQLGRFLPGHKLPAERDLADQLSVSRTTVREAVRILVAEGALSVRRGASGGLIVNQLHVADADELRSFIRQRRSEFNDIFDFRAVVEGATAELAAQRRGMDHLQRMRQKLEEMTTAIDASLGHENPDPVAVFHAADTSFHLEIARASQNKHLQASVESIRRAMFIPVGGVFIKLRKDANQIHEPILDAISDRDGPRARLRMVEHVESTRRAMMEFLDDRTPAPQV
ncbi:FadR/GntR family transcriptional regulator [Mesorhizobium sp. CO1-1-8]|uniref:FadR/GntR family transcriptional regulator n=1 Tax=Mesorhizobium sp. CO1-1-8 TaxID=2876631 RepID=UPI001CD132A1|nr:FCD domain-containing protein [Mesorhizobium sp. CO1-1-8]MBZ9772449.1 FCD domain-containing protein [Mesorhizobium sp. CO1-1-8]